MIPSLSETLAGKRVFLTGHTGFKGSWLALWLHHLGAQVYGYALQPPTEPNNYSVSQVGAVLTGETIADLCDRRSLGQALQQAEPDLVLHLAAQSVVRTGYADPWTTFQTNVMGTASLLEELRVAARPCAVLCVTSDKCYENREQVWGYREQDGLGDHDPYGGSKGAAELVIRSYRSSFFPPARLADHGVALASARAGNVIGGGDWKHHALLPDAFRALEKQHPIAVRNPQSFRPWQHVLQCLSGYLSIAAKLLGDDPHPYCTGWNIGPLPGNELPVHEVLDHFLAEWGSGTWEHIGDPHQPREATILRLSIDKAIWDLRWMPAWNVADAIRHTARWYRQYLETPGEMQAVCLGQIAAYESAMEAPHGSAIATP